NAASGSTVIDENRGQDDLRQNPKKRGTSKDVVASLDQRVAGVETSIAELKNQVEGLEGLDSDFASMRDDFRVALNTLSDELKREIHDLRDSFMGVNVVDDASKIKIATRYLKDTATLWWRRRFEDIERGTTTINTWAEFMADFKKQFYSDNAKNKAKSRLRKLKQSKTIRDMRRESFEPKDQKVNQEKGGGEKNAQPKGDAARKPPTGKDKNLKTSYKSGGCFICDGPHRARDFSKKASLNGMSAHEDEEASDGGSLGSIWILNAIKANTEVPKVVGKGLQYVEATINGVKVHGLVDTGVTHKFVADDEAKRLGINTTKGSGTIKAVDSPAKAIHGVAKDVRAKIGEWEGTIDLSVVSMDDFKVVLGLEFLDKVLAFPMSFANSLCILDGGKTCMVSTERDAKSGAKTLSAMQIKKGFNKSKPCYLAVTRLETDKGSCKVEEGGGSYHRVRDGFQPPPLPAKSPYRMPPPKLEELCNQLKELMDVGYIRPLKASYGAPVLFQRKKDGSLRMCIEYRALNKVTINNNYPISLIANLFDQLGKARYFTKLDLRPGYYQVRITEGDEAKTTCVTRYGSYEFLVMPFGLTNAPATFCTLINKLYHLFLDKFIVVYLDDIVVYSHTLEDHFLHLKQVLQVLRDNELYVKLEKCSFAQDEVKFLGHKIKDGGLMMEGANINAIQD
nr:hypothetical protein [Tanacetum cinerariifolium]